MTQQFERESMNFRLPKPLADALRKVATPKPGFTATDIVIRALQKELGDIQGIADCTEVRLDRLEAHFEQLAASHNSELEEKVESLITKVSKIEGVLTALQSSGLARSRSYGRKNSGNPYNQTGRPAQIQPLDEEKLALRLNVKIPELKEKRETLSNQEFEEWSKNRDRTKYSWFFNLKDGLYHPRADK